MPGPYRPNAGAKLEFIVAGRRAFAQSSSRNLSSKSRKLPEKCRDPGAGEANSPRRQSINNEPARSTSPRGLESLWFYAGEKRQQLCPMTSSKRQRGNSTQHEQQRRRLGHRFNISSDLATTKHRGMDVEVGDS